MHHRRCPALLGSQLLEKKTGKKREDKKEIFAAGDMVRAQARPRQPRCWLPSVSGAAGAQAARVRRVDYLCNGTGRAAAGAGRGIAWHRWADTALVRL